MRSTRQAGVVFGGVLTLTGMLGMISVFSGGVTADQLMGTISLLVPQGWAIRALFIAREGGTIADLAPTLLVILLWTVVLASIGTWRLRRRYA